MDNQLLIIWIIMVVVALGLDVAAYLFLRADWEKNGSTLTDRFWNQIFDRVDQTVKIWQNRIAIALVKYHQASMAPASAPTIAPAIAPVLESEPLPNPEEPVEIIPVSVKNIGQVRRVQFSLEMPLDTQVEVRIGATREAGVTVEKREL